MEQLTMLEKDTIAEVGNISLGSSATALSAILDKAVDITTPELEEISGADVRQKYPVPCLLVEVNYISGLQGSNMLLIKESDALIIAALMMGEAYEGKQGPLSEIELSAVQEAMNQMMGSMATAMSELFQRPIEISPPAISSINLADDDRVPEKFAAEERFVHVRFSMLVEDIIDSAMVQVIPVDFARQMAADLLGGETETASLPDKEPVSGAEAVSVSGDDNEQDLATLAEKEVLTAPGEESPGPEDLSALERDTISEVGNISLGASATALAMILDKAVDITTPKLSVARVDQIKEKYPVPCLLVEVNYISGLQGSNMLLIKESDALIIAALMMGEAYEGKQGPLSEIELSAVQEAMNQMMGSMATAMSELFQRPIDISPPEMTLINLAEEHSMLEGLAPEAMVVQVEFTMKVENIIDSVMVQVIPVEFARDMAGYLLYGEQNMAAGSPSAAAEEKTDHLAGMTGGDVPASGEENEVIFFEPVSAAPEFSGPKAEKYGDKMLSADLQKLELVRDIPMDIIVVLGSARIPLGKLFSLDRGGIIDLDCGVSDPVELMANDRLLAKGEVVMINDQLGVRITEIEFDEVIESYGI